MPFVGRTRWGHWMLCSCGPRTWLGPFPPTLGLASPWTELPRVGTPFWSVAAVSGDSGLPCEGPCPCVPVLSLTLYPGLRGKSGQRFQLLTRRFGAGMRAPREPRVSGAWGGHAGQRSLQLRAGLGPAPARRRRGGRRSEAARDRAPRGPPHRWARCVLVSPSGCNLRFPGNVQCGASPHVLGCYLGVFFARGPLQAFGPFLHHAARVRSVGF